MIYTSYFGNYRNFPEGSLIVSVTRFPPKNWDGLELRSLAPSADLLQKWKNKQVDEKMFELLYLAELENLGMNGKEIAEHLRSLGRDVILCCYESSGFCHRNILNKWLGGDGELGAR